MSFVTDFLFILVLFIDICSSLKIGGPQFHQYVMLEVHYNNPELRRGIVDRSGIKFFLTPRLRKFDAGIMELGLIYNNWMAIPPRTNRFTLSGVCVPECTGMWDFNPMSTLKLKNHILALFGQWSFNGVKGT